MILHQEVHNLSDNWSLNVPNPQNEEGKRIMSIQSELGIQKYCFSFQQVDNFYKR